MKPATTWVGIIVATLLARVVSGGTTTNEWGTITNGVQMSIGMLKGTNRATQNQPIELLIKLQNLSTNDAIYFSIFRVVEDDYHFSIEVKAPSGRKLSRTRGISVLGSGRLVRLRKDEVEQFPFNLSQIYKFDELGTYQIIARLKAGSIRTTQGIEIVSNPLSITIVPHHEAR